LLAVFLLSVSANKFLRGTQPRTSEDVLAPKEDPPQGGVSSLERKFILLAVLPPPSNDACGGLANFKRNSSRRSDEQADA
jgi:hypothetical protein